MTLRGMPWGVAVFLVYALLILAGIGLTLRFVIDLATEMAVSVPGVVDMVLLAYTIFTITLVVQRKTAARGLAMGLSSLTLPPIAFFVVNGQPAIAACVAVVAVALFRGLTRPAAAAWLNEP